MALRITGKLPSGKHLERLRQSPHFKKKGFENLSVTPMKSEDTSYWRMTCEFLRKNRNASPPAPLPSVKTDLQKLSSSEPVFIWFGHSSYFLRVNNRNFLVDPVFSGNAAPLSFMIRAFKGSDIYKASDMPVIDYLILSHDHYDHLDYRTIRKLNPRIKAIYCSLGIGSHLRYWGVGPEKITEMDWWDERDLDGNIQLTAAPARHFSGRGIKRFQTLWSSFILRSQELNLYLGGDSGYDVHFKQIGEKYGPFDLAILEAGQYNKMWPLVHMFPEETVQAAIDLKAKALIPVHWGKFSLAMHEWNEPVRRVMKKAKEAGLVTHTPKIGEAIYIGKPYSGTDWWDM